MKPALSVIFFTVSSGAGLGLAVWLLAMQLAGRVDASNRQFWLAFAAAALLVTAGLISSTLHLANPRNAWRAFARFRSSWLSREGVLAVALYPIAVLHAWLSFRQSDAARVTGLLLIVLSLSTVVCTAMIYACLKTVPRWRTWHTPVSYLLYALAGGGLIWIALSAFEGASLAQAGLAGSVAVQLLTAAERTGGLPACFERLATADEARLAKLLDRATTAWGPVLLLGVAAVVGCVVLALYWPMLQVFESVR